MRIKKYDLLNILSNFDLYFEEMMIQIRLFPFMHIYDPLKFAMIANQYETVGL